MYLPFVFAICIYNGYLYTLVSSYTQNSRCSVTETINHMSPLKSGVIKDPASLNNNNDPEYSDISEEEHESGKSWSGVSEFALIVQCV